MSASKFFNIEILVGESKRQKEILLGGLGENNPAKIHGGWGGVWGFRDLEIFNLPLLAKQAWRMLIRPESLCFQVLKSVYFPCSDILNVSVGSNPSKTWRAICDGIEVMNQGLIKWIGDGKTTQIWGCNWIPRTGMFRPLFFKETKSANTCF